MSWKKYMRKIKRFIKECKYALNQLKKPSAHEYWTMVKITGTIIMLTGLIGYVFYLLFNYVIFSNM